MLRVQPFLCARFGKGYQLKIKTDPGDDTIAMLKKFIIDSFQECILKEEYNGEMTFQVGSQPCRLRTCYKLLKARIFISKNIFNYIILYIYISPL